MTKKKTDEPEEYHETSTHQQPGGALIRGMYYVRMQRRVSLSELGRRCRAIDPGASGRGGLAEFENRTGIISVRSLMAVAAVLRCTVDELLAEYPMPEGGKQHIHRHAGHRRGRRPRAPVDA